MQSKSKVLNGVFVLAMAGLLMGNKGCEEKQTAPVRKLKKIVELGALVARPIELPQGGSFDFQFVANQQIYSVLAANEAFTLRYNAPITEDPQLSANEEFLNLTKADKVALKSFANKSGRPNLKASLSKEAWCMANLPQAKIQGSVNSFEMIGGGGVQIGFTPEGAYNSGGLSDIGLQINVARLDLSLVATRPLTEKLLAAANVNSKQTQTKVSFTFNAGAFRVGPSAYYQTPLAKVTEKALQKGVLSLDEQLQKEEWYTRVLTNHDTHLVVIGGQDVGLQAGDELLIYNEETYWEGEPCNSRYLGGGAQASNAVAKIKIDWVGDEISRGQVIEQNEENAVVGAKVKIFKLAPAVTTPPGQVRPPQ